jgi:hypothetical protein
LIEFEVPVEVIKEVEKIIEIRVTPEESKEEENTRVLSYKK